MQDQLIRFNFQGNEAVSLFLVILRSTLLSRPVNHSHFLANAETPAESVQAVASRLALVKLPKNLQAIASQKNLRNCAFNEHKVTLRYVSL